MEQLNINSFEEFIKYIMISDNEKNLLNCFLSIDLFKDEENIYFFINGKNIKTMKQEHLLNWINKINTSKYIARSHLSNEILKNTKQVEYSNKIIFNQQEPPFNKLTKYDFSTYNLTEYNLNDILNSPIMNFKSNLLFGEDITPDNFNKDEFQELLYSESYLMFNQRDDVNYTIVFNGRAGIGKSSNSELLAMIKANYEPSDYRFEIHNFTCSINWNKSRKNVYDNDNGVKNPIFIYNDSAQFNKLDEEKFISLSQNITLNIKGKQLQINDIKVLLETNTFQPDNLNTQVKRRLRIHYMRGNKNINKNVAKISEELYKNKEDVELYVNYLYSLHNKKILGGYITENSTKYLGTNIHTFFDEYIIFNHELYDRLDHSLQLDTLLETDLLFKNSDQINQIDLYEAYKDYVGLNAEDFMIFKNKCNKLIRKQINPKKNVLFKNNETYYSKQIKCEYNDGKNTRINFYPYIKLNYWDDEYKRNKLKKKIDELDKDEPNYQDKRLELTRQFNELEEKQ